MARIARLSAASELAWAACYLDRSPLANIAPRWQLLQATEGRSGREFLRFQEGDAQGLLILARRSPWSGLPRCWRMVMMDTDCPDTLEAMLTHLPERRRLCFLVQRPWFAPRVVSLFPGERLKSEIYYSLHPADFRPYLGWPVTQLGVQHAKLLARGEGWTRDVPANLRYPGDHAWGVIDDDRVVGSCCCTEITPRVVTIQGVYSAERYRGMGVARSVVTAAARAILADARTPFYCADEDNGASRRVAESLGFRAYLEHQRWLGSKTRGRSR